jgi:hypothetical protein
LVFELDKYSVSIIKELNNFSDSKDEIPFYEKEYLPESICFLSNKFGIRIFEKGIEINRATIVNGFGATSLHERSQVFYENQILICCGDSVFCLDIPALILKWKTKVDEITAFQIFKLDGGYVVHGELEITKINKEGDILWQNSGRDIFITPEGKNDFEIKDSYIQAKDWDHQIYKWNFDGEEIK